MASANVSKPDGFLLLQKNQYLLFPVRVIMAKAKVGAMDKLACPCLRIYRILSQSTDKQSLSMAPLSQNLNTLISNIRY